MISAPPLSHTAVLSFSLSRSLTRSLTHSRAAGMSMISASLLLYTAVIVPVQILMWSYDDPCVMFPTLYFDMFVDAFFIVR